jgi:hypothetical protein
MHSDIARIMHELSAGHPPFSAKFKGILNRKWLNRESGKRTFRQATPTSYENLRWSAMAENLSDSSSAFAAVGTLMGQRPVWQIVTSHQRDNHAEWQPSQIATVYSSC